MKINNNSRVLMIDDDESLLGIMAMRLRQSGYLVDASVESHRGYKMAISQPYDLLILDVSMPELSGLEVCANLRAQGVLTPIIMLSGITDKLNIVSGLELGADDYLTKPFSHGELMARMQALVRRNNKTFSARWVRGHGLKLDTGNCVVTFGNKSQALTIKESALLRRLIDEASEPVARQSLLKDIWGIDNTHTSNRLDVYIRRLRSKLGNIGATNLIQTLRGNGYSLGPPKR